MTGSTRRGRHLDQDSATPQHELQSAVLAGAVRAAEQVCASRRAFASRSAVALVVVTPTAVAPETRERVRAVVVRTVRDRLPGVLCLPVGFVVRPGLSTWVVVSRNGEIKPVEGPPPVTVPVPEPPQREQKPAVLTRPGIPATPAVRLRPTNVLTGPPYTSGRQVASGVSTVGYWLQLEVEGSVSRHLLDQELGWRPFGRQPAANAMPAGMPLAVVVPGVMTSVPRGWLLEVRLVRGSVEIRRTVARPEWAVAVDKVALDAAGPAAILSPNGWLTFQVADDTGTVRYALSRAAAS